MITPRLLLIFLTLELRNELYGLLTLRSDLFDENRPVSAVLKYFNSMI